MEYVMLEGVNDQPEHARQLIKILEGIPVKVNLIPFNPFFEPQKTLPRKICLPCPRHRQGIFRDIFGNRGASPNKGVFPQLHRCYQLGIRTDKNIIANCCLVLVYSIVVAGNHPRANVYAFANLGITDVRKVVRL